MVTNGLLILKCIVSESFHVGIILLVPSQSHLLLQVRLFGGLVNHLSYLSRRIGWGHHQFFHLVLQMRDGIQMLLKSL